MLTCRDEARFTCLVHDTYIALERDSRCPTSQGARAYIACTWYEFAVMMPRFFFVVLFVVLAAWVHTKNPINTHTSGVFVFGMFAIFGEDF